jgi:hypothetical protein
MINLRFPKIQLLAAVPTQLKFSIVKDHDELTILLFDTLFCTWECFNMGTELPTKVMLGQTLAVMKLTFLNNVRKVGRLVLSRTSCICIQLERSENLEEKKSLGRLRSIWDEHIKMNLIKHNRKPNL